MGFPNRPCPARGMGGPENKAVSDGGAAGGPAQPSRAAKTPRFCGSLAYLLVGGSLVRPNTYLQNKAVLCPLPAGHWA